MDDLTGLAVGKIAGEVEEPTAIPETEFSTGLTVGRAVASKEVGSPRGSVGRVGFGALPN
jgi:hypothetical protein